ncbi:hypothetical protein T552_04122 [Pneumocystis carinii B80]|uniref:Major facilitator superfamily (MFS) profile domain-containing protein n=1 Tax=Pneumocystis carinii (strain B80) TaxID=1408658 RepID=A0A0W4ZJ49_PNEC8|nr:hypothetical protein T552_04122 [Pneumocystis carinii B80]KTW28389.1 hypothetical protein T552_04122 [Pneumocystis carinii B80]
MKFRRQADPIELSFLIAKKEDDANDRSEEKYKNEYASFFTKTLVQLNDKREETVKIVFRLERRFYDENKARFLNKKKTKKNNEVKELKKGNMQSSLLIKSFILINPIIPIISGLLVEKYGAGTSLFPIYLTGIIFFGQCISIIAALSQWKYIVTLGLFLSGLCINPLVIVQETLLIEIFQDNLGFCISILLSVGKLIFFISSLLTNTFGGHLIYGIKILFIVSCALSLFSFSICIAYSQIMNKNKKVVFITFKEKSVFKSIETMPIYFWWYLLISFLSNCIWTPFIYFLHKIEHVNFLKNIAATDISSIVLLLSVALYPIIGWFNDNSGHRLSMEIIGNVIMQSMVHIILNLNKKKGLTNTDINAVIMLFSILNMLSLVFLAALYRHDNIYNKKYINHCLYNLFHKKSKMMYQDIIFRSKEIALKSTRTYLGFITTGLILSWILYIKIVS